MTESKLKKFAKHYGISKTIKNGADDIIAMKERLRQLKDQNHHVAFKFPGEDGELSPETEIFLKKEDLFIFLMTRFQKSLLMKFGSTLAIDATHSAFVYSKVIIIVVLVASFSQTENIKERGKLK